MVDTQMVTSLLESARFEVLPFARSVDEAAQLPENVRLTVTCSPKHGPDRSVETAGRLRELGHHVTIHVAARMVSDRDHLDRILSAMAEGGADDLFLIGGDADPPLGAYSSAVELLDIVAEHPLRPRTIGIAGYPEGHPAIADEALEQALAHKSRHADYVATQMCFDPEAAGGVDLPPARERVDASRAHRDPRQGLTDQADGALGAHRRRPIAVVLAQAAWDPCAAVQRIDSRQAL